MCEINKNICLKNSYRQRLFDELLRLGYKKSTIKEYGVLRKNEIETFGSKKCKNVNLGNEFRQLFVALIILLNLKGKKAEVEVIGDGFGFFAAELFEYRLLNLIINSFKNSETNTVSAVLNITDKALKLTVFYMGKPLEKIEDFAYQFYCENKVIINYSAKFIPTKKGEFKYAWEWMKDRLSDLNIALIDI